MDARGDAHDLAALDFGILRLWFKACRLATAVTLEAQETTCRRPPKRVDIETRVDEFVPFVGAFAVCDGVKKAHAAHLCDHTD